MKKILNIVILLLHWNKDEYNQKLKKKNLPANAGDISLISGLGRFRIPWGQLSPWATTIEAHTLWSPCSTPREATVMRSL